MKQQMLLPKDKSILRCVLHDAISCAHKFWCDELDPSGIRKKSSRTFNEVLEQCLEGSCLWTCIHRTSVSGEAPHWEFGATTLTDTNCLWILVPLDKAQDIFERYGIEEKKHYL